MRSLRARAKDLVDALPLVVRRAVKRGHLSRMVRSERLSSEEPDLDLALEVLEEGDWVIDVGANVGHYTVPLGRRLGAGGRVIAIEPVAETFELLASNVNAAGLSNVTLLNLAASAEAAMVGMAIPRDGTGFRWMTRARIAAGGGAATVLALPVDRIPFPERIRLVKIDAEGHEAKVLAGMGALLRRDLPVLIVEASRGHDIPLLTELGYARARLPGSPNIVYATEADLECVRRGGAAEARGAATPAGRTGGVRP